MRLVHEPNAAMPVAVVVVVPVAVVVAVIAAEIAIAAVADPAGNL